MKKFTCIFCFLGWIASDLYAQSNSVASGGNASGSGGSVSYTIGQIDYISKTGSGGNMSEGVQQPYEIFITGVENEKGINLMTVYPNPSTSFLNLRVEDINSQNLYFQLYDVSANLLLMQKINSTETLVPVENLSTGIYILKVTDNNKEVQSFKIIKNK